MTFETAFAAGLDTAERTDQKLYRILIRDLLLMASIGIHAHEKLAPQRVRINVDLSVHEAAGPTDDDIANVLSYEDVISDIKEMIGRGHINLVETMAEQIAALCLTDRRVESARVRVEKLDVYADAASVGVEIERRQGLKRGPAAMSR